MDETIVFGKPVALDTGYFHPGMLNTKMSIVETFNECYSLQSEVTLAMRRMSNHHAEYAVTSCFWLVKDVVRVHPWSVNLTMTTGPGGLDGECAATLQLKQPDVQRHLPLHVILWRDQLWCLLQHDNNPLLDLIDICIRFCPWINKRMFEK